MVFNGLLQSDRNGVVLAQAIQLQELKAADQSAQGFTSVIPPSNQPLLLQSVRDIASSTAVRPADAKTINPQALSQTSTDGSNSTARVGLTGSPGQLYNQPSLSNAKEFSIQYKTVEGRQKIFYFSLLPAIESNLKGNVIGASVPEVKPGILEKTTMAMKRFTVPGSAPVFQVLGIEQTILQLVGLFIGAEGAERSSTADSVLYGTSGAQSLTTPTSASAYQQAKLFNQEVVQSGQEVELVINSGGESSLRVRYRCVLQNFRCFVVRYDRVYYAIDACVTGYTTPRLPLSQSAAVLPVSTPAATSTPTTSTTTTTTITTTNNSNRPTSTPSSNPGNNAAAPNR